MTAVLACCEVLGSPCVEDFGRKPGKVTARNATQNQVPYNTKAQHYPMPRERW
jgi:hypothetical protein